MRPQDFTRWPDEDPHIGFLNEIARRMSLAPPLHEVLRQLIGFAATVVKCDSCFVYVLEKDELVLRASKNPHPEIIDRLKLKVGEGITGWVAEYRQPVAVALNAYKDPRFKLFNDLPEDHFESFLSVPLVSRGHLVGVINLQDRKPHHYSTREIGLISTVGTLAGAEIEMARLQDEERGRIARVLHDSLGQELVVAQLSLQQVPEDSYANTDWAAPLREGIASVGRALEQVRSLSYLWQPPLDDSGLLPALQRYVDGIIRTGVQVKAIWPEEMPKLPFELETAILRIVQESLTNVYRHSTSKVAELEIASTDGHVCINVRDYGQGPNLSGSKPGVGIRGMRERARQLGGELTITDAKPGTAIEVKLPISFQPSRR